MLSLWQITGVGISLLPVSGISHSALHQGLPPGFSTPLPSTLQPVLPLAQDPSTPLVVLPGEPAVHPSAHHLGRAHAISVGWTWQLFFYCPLASSASPLSLGGSDLPVLQPGVVGLLTPNYSS